MALKIMIKAAVQTVKAKTAIDEMTFIAFCFFLANKYLKAMKIGKFNYLKALTMIHLPFLCGIAISIKLRSKTAGNNKSE